MLSLGARKQERLILIFQKTLLPQQKMTDAVGNSTFFTLIVTKNVHNVLMKVATGSKTKKNPIKLINTLKKITEDAKKLICSLFYVIDASVVQNLMENPERLVKFPTSTLQNCSTVDVLCSLKNWNVIES